MLRSCGWLLVLHQAFGTFLFMKWSKYWILEPVWPFLSFTRSQDVILSLHSEDEARKVPGIHGQVYPAVTDAFESLLLMEETSETAIAALERFVVLLYDRTSDLLQVNDARKQLFTQKSRSLENIPPTYAALKEHVKRASYQAYCWNQALVPNPDIPSPSDWGWEKNYSGCWQPFWTTLSQASNTCYELIHCGCKKGCRGKCKCVKAA